LESSAKWVKWVKQALESFSPSRIAQVARKGKTILLAQAMNLEDNERLLGICRRRWSSFRKFTRIYRRINQASA
jgi:hypothetical protein